MLRAALVGFLLLAPLAAAQTPVIVNYHVWPDPEAGKPDADPFSAPGVAPLPGLPGDRMPATRADAVEDADPAPGGNPDSSVAHLQEFQRLLALRGATGAGATIDVEGAAQPGALLVRVNVTATEALGATETRVVLVEDDAGHRFAARNASAPLAANLSAGQSASFDVTLPLGAADAQKVGVVVTVRALDAVGPRQAGEVVNAASWSVRQGAPTRQVEKAVLLEHVTATWCEPCGPSDQALALLAARTAPQESGARYLQPPTPWTVAGLALGAGALLLLVRRRAA
ncbi:MAG: hypothetical protein QOE90_723 [Thermoplasmata archaeon]|nr:hypothetical protein [Thermoplasmata archaeon]